MRKTCLLFAAMIALAAPPPGRAGASAGEGDPAPILVTPAWLASHVNDEGLLIFQVGSSRREYAKAHIPHARFLWTSSLAVNTEDLTLEIPPQVQADSVLRSLGISPGMRIVLYGTGGNVPPVARVFMTLEYFGLAGSVSLLDGGLDAWKAGGGTLTAALPSASRGRVTATAHPDQIVDAGWVASHMHDSSVALVDARTSQYYEGHGGGMPRPGHIPGALSIPFSSLLDSAGRFLDHDALAKKFSSAGVKPGATVVSYCHIGQQASVVYLIARMLGHPARVYDGSFEDWSSRDDLPVAGPGQPR